MSGPAGPIVFPMRPPLGGGPPPPAPRLVLIAGDVFLMRTKSEVGLPDLLLDAADLAMPQLLLDGGFAPDVGLVTGDLVLPAGLLVAGDFAPVAALDTADWLLPQVELSGDFAPLVSVAAALALPLLELAGEETPAVSLAAAVALPQLQLAGAFAPAVTLDAALILPLLQLGGAETPGVSVAAAVLLPQVALAGDFAPTVTAIDGALALPQMQLGGAFTPFTPSAVACLVAHWSGNGSTVSSAPNRIAGSSVGALAQATTADRPTLITTTNGVKALSFDGVNQDMKTADVAALRFTGPRGYWAWHLRSVDTVLAANTSPVSEWAEGGTAERFLILTNALAGETTARVAINSISFADATFNGTLPALQAGCWLELLFDGSQSSANSGLDRCVLCVDGVPLARSGATGVMPAVLQVGDALNYWLGSLNGAGNKHVDIAHHYVGNDIPTATERGLLRAFEAPQWDTPNLYPSPVVAGVGPASGATTTTIVGWPVHVLNDIGLLCVETANQPIATPSGWTAVTGGSQGAGTAASVTATRLQVFWRRAASSAEPSVALTSPGDHVVGLIATFRGCISSGDPIHVSAGDDGGDVDATAVTIPGATTTLPNCLIVAIASRQTDIASVQQSGETNASLAGLTERTDQGTAAGNGGGIGIVTGVKAVAGAYSATTATLATASRQGRVSFALRPNP